MDKREFNKFKQHLVNDLIYYNYHHKKIDDKLVFVESKSGNDFTGNVFRIVEELSTGKYGKLKIQVYAKVDVENRIRELQKNYDLKIDKIITKESIATRTLEKAKYIVSDYDLPAKYVKREGQVFLNAWHEIPFKVMGKDDGGEEHLLGDLQYPLLCSDYLVCPNEFMMETLTNAYMIEKIFPGKVLMEGFAKNSVFLDDVRREELKAKFGWEDLEIFAYVPDDAHNLNDKLIEIDGNLKDSQLLLVDVDKYTESLIDFSKFMHVKSFPRDYESYDIANLADILITDHSSVFFDFAITQRKIIMFNDDHDNKEFYIPLSDLPFPIVNNVFDLVRELNLPKNYDDAEFIKKFCQYDNVNSAENICCHVFNNQKMCSETTVKNDKENILIFVGSFLNNGITASVKNLLSNIDRDKYNFFLSYRQWDNYVIENHEEIFKSLPDNIEFLPLNSWIIPTVMESSKHDNFFFTDKKMPFDKKMHRLFKRSYDKQYFGLDFKMVINYDGYNKNELLIFTHSGVKNAVWVHNDMIQEIKTRGNQNFDILHEAYCAADSVCVVSKDLIKPTSEISGRTDNIRIIHNINNYETIINNSKKEIQFDKSTVFHSSYGSIEEVLSKDGLKFITIGRFSPEKGHERLIKAFNRFCRDYPDSQLIIIGGHGELYEDTVELAESSEFGANISLIKGISNPMPILKQCDLFILPSFYEGWGIVIMEADTLDIPVVATDVVGTQWLRDYDGNLVENSEEGILNGMLEFMKGDVNTLNIDYKKFNEEIIDSFYSLLES
ncbi:MAG: CDP-glycerol glycerophosphotransferase family protein [Methanobrevibacter sp.]|nr:CDP-glycerol glycerophosphotransferase family protein [Methanobrevibacter sp.]